MIANSLRFDHVCKRFGERVILDDITFEITPGQIVFILGKSGMGKSVTLKHLVGVLRPDRGRVFVGEHEVSRLEGEGLAAVRRACGMVFQHPALLDSLTVFENVAFGLRVRKLPETEIRKTVIEKLRLVHLGEDILERAPIELSYGMQKRVSLARTLAPGPEHLLFDEPTTGLDPITTSAVNDLILELARKLGVTSVVVSHDMACALKIADRILVLDGGKIVCDATPAQIRNSNLPLVRDFLSETLSREAAGTQGAHA